eukprot:comp16940_c0_seq1/m.15529 comp16940_c0_seq1/g.15529  ORF comp16940_c0_seq1/g.15529 comp16940_c0_seq1/m.15529 type:complete len:218 (-) comp16940_c0_seq1:611-1264(-)
MGLSASRYKRVYELTNLLQTKRFENPQVKDYPRILSIINETEFFKYSGNAMIPTLEDTETLLEVRKKKSLQDVYVGDVIALTQPKTPSEAPPEVLIRRLTAKGNDELVSTEGQEPMRVPAGHVWVSCDNDKVAGDSREFGPVPADSVLGRVTATLNASYQPIGVVVNSPKAMEEDASAQLVTADLLQAYIKQIKQMVPMIKRMQGDTADQEKSNKDK